MPNDWYGGSVGAWGPGLFSDDIACDVRGEFRDLIGDGLTTEEATNQVLRSYPSVSEDPGDGSVVVIALAVTQWKTGRLLDEVKSMAIDAIDHGADLDRWSDDPKLHKRRSDALLRARSQLLLPQRTPVRIPKRERCSTPFQSGDVIVHNHDSGTQFVLWVSGTMTDKGGAYTQVELLDVDPVTVASNPVLVADSPPRLRNRSGGQGKLATGYLLLDCQNYASDRYSVVGRVDRPSGRVGHDLRAIRIANGDFDRRLDQFV